ESSIWHGTIDGGGSSTWWRCHPGSPCASQAAGLHDRRQRAQRPGALHKGIRFACAENGQRLRWGVYRGRTGNTGRGESAARTSRHPSLGQHGGAATLAQISPSSGWTQEQREVGEVQRRRCSWLEIVAAHT